MVRRLADASLVDACVEGQLKIDVAIYEVFVAYDFESGPAAVLGRICVFGNESTPATPILGATFFEPRTRFSLSDLDSAQRAIYALGMFVSVEIRHRAEDVTSSREESVDPATREVDITAETRVPNPDPVRDPESAEPITRPMALHIATYYLLTQRLRDRTILINGILLERFGDRLRAIREARGWSQERMAAECGLHRTYGGGVERGERNVSLVNIARLAAALGVA
jgi:ribosome-binding protein aMBF1 (putative translation factor)